ncbi:sclerotinia Sclerotiorum agglutinin Ssa in complex with Gal-Beta1,3-Galnac [Xylariaceae sp. AK1471]|nr:sclerotinia Sclerotiorum agglutinin Ssa in complex with Gal-Beta1,3-Galnac [Xylariaceae sp. AK1471]
MGFTGPGVYEIVPFQAPELSANSWGGGKEPGAEVRTFTRDRINPTKNTLWQVALVAGSGDTAEYLIINVNSGYFLTATADQTITSTPQIAPNDPTCHWTIKSAPTNGYDVFLINNQVTSRGQLNVEGSSTKSGTPILAWPIENGDNSKWYFDPHN